MKQQFALSAAFVFTLLTYINVFSQTNMDGFTPQTYTNAANTYNFTYWDANFKTNISSRKFTNQTSSYNLNIDYTNLNINSLDVNLNNSSTANALQEANATTFQTLQAGTIDYKILQNGTTLHAKTATPTNLGVKISQMAEYGTWLNRRVVDSLNFTNSPSLYGSFSGIEFTNWHNRFKITFHIKPRATISNGQLELSVQMPSVFSQTYNSGNIYGFAKSANGEGFALKGGVTAANVSTVGNTIKVQTAQANLNADTPYELSLIFYAVKTNFSTTYVATADDAANVAVNVSQSLPSARSVTTNYAADEGLYFVEVPSYWMGYNNCNAIDGLQNLKLTLSNTNATEKRVRLCFRQNPAPNIVGFSSMLRNPNGDPAGLPLQISKNWHNTTPMLYSGTWIREYTEVIIPANTTLKFDYTRIGARWGKVYGAFSHQLSVVGEGVPRGGWLEAGLGSFGENITHSPDYEYGNSNICDYRPFLVTNGSYGGTSRQCFWTGNTGGMNMFVYNNNSNTRIYQSQVKTRFKKYGPNLTETSIATYSSDNKLKLDYSFFLNRSDDFVRVFYKIKIKALENTPFSRFDIFQLGSDTYNYRKAQSLVYGNDTGLVGQFTPSNAGSNNYTTAATALTGTNPWIWSGDALSLDANAELTIPTNNAIIIRSYTASLGGQSANTPYFRERSSSHSSASKPTQYCLVPPPTITSFMQGDSIELLLEAVCLPKQAIDYYGPNTRFSQALTQYGNTWELLYREVLGNKIHASSPTNSINTDYPLSVTTTNNTGLVTITGGKGYIPMVFKGLTNINNPKLWKAKSNGWEWVNQANHGKDFWQTEYDVSTGLFELIYNVNQDTINDNTNIIKYYLGDTPPMPTMVLQSKINQNAITTNSNIITNERDTLIFTPQVTENGITSNGNGGKWQWTGVNGYTANSRTINLNRLQLTDAGNYTVTYTDTFGCAVAATFQLSVNVGLPVTLTRFSATPLSKTNLLTWETSSETHNKGFDIQRQEPNGSWLTIGFVAAQGKATIYNFEDNTPRSISYYRLRQIDFDGKENLSKIVSVQREENGIVYISPNPTSSKVQISLFTNQPIKNINIYDLSGRNILSQKIDNTHAELDFSAFAKGIYILEIQSDTKVFREKIVRH
jgi:Secretion system C-terminal sorting domain